MLAKHLGKEVLTEIAEEDFYAAIPELRAHYGDRAVLRGVHEYQENARVLKQVAALESGNFDEFLRLIKESGFSSWMYLQNVIPAGYKEHQDMAIALAPGLAMIGFISLLQGARSCLSLLLAIGVGILTIRNPISGLAVAATIGAMQTLLARFLPHPDTHNDNHNKGGD